jgi:ComF family protein
LEDKNLNQPAINKKFRIESIIYRCLWRTIDFVYPPKCAVCGRSGISLCADCYSKIAEISKPFCKICGRRILSSGICEDCTNDPPPFQSARSWAFYVDPLRAALLTLKYKNNIGLAQILSYQMITIIRQNKWDFDCIVPVPLCRSHMKERGYNQSEMLAYPISFSLGIPLIRDAVFRIKETRSQVHLDREERFKNVEDAFFAKVDKLNGKRVLLVDDIFTTGATLRSCSKAIQNAGSKTIFCITVAQTVY